MNRPLLWWHFSDLHWDVRSSTERRAFLAVLYEHLKQRVEEFGPPDFVVFSGDVSRSGEEAQFVAAEQEFFTPLRALSSNVDCPFFVVPGNHDVRRASAKTVNPQLVLSINSTRALNEFLDLDEYVQMVRRPFTAFGAFSSRTMASVTQEALGWWSKLQVRGASILIVGLNSSWASSYHTNSENSIEDERHLLLGQRQLGALVEHCRKVDLSIVIIHHPLQWLNGFSETQCRQLLQRHADFVLFGHTHALHDLSQTLGGTGSTVFLPAPAIYDRTPTDTIEYARGYNIVTFDVASKRGAAYYYKYADVYATKFDPFIELYASSGQDSFAIDLSHRKSEPAAELRPRFQSFSEALTAFANLAKLNDFLETRLEAQSLERHTVEYFESLIIDLVRESDIVDEDQMSVFWESVVLCRALLYCEQVQLESLGTKPYLYRHSVDALLNQLAGVPKAVADALQLTLDEYRRLYGMSFDSCSLSAASVTSVSESYRRLFAIPWAVSRLLLYLDYPQLIPTVLRSEGRLADLFALGKPEQLAILACRFDSKRSILSIDLGIQEKNSFLAVTPLKHYFDIVLRRAADFWRQCQRVLPPLTLLLEFPRWRNKRVDAFELTVETTPIVKLLMGRAMYRDARHVWFREILQNALDANSARRALEGSCYPSRLDIALHGSDTCTIRDNGIGMSQQHILMYLTRLGRSIWNSGELTEGKPIARETALRAIGKFGIGFAAVFQDAERVIVRTRFFRDVGETGWLVDFSSVEKPFLLEAAECPVGTEVEVQLRHDSDKALSPAGFIKLVNDFFVYIDENVFITPDPKIARNLSEVALADADKLARMLFRDTISAEQVGPYSFRLRCMFAFDFKQKDKEDRPPASYLLVSNSGVRVFEQPSLLLKPGKQYILIEESEKGTKYEDTREHGIKHFWIVIDFDKGASPILPSRLEIEIEGGFAKQVLDLIHQHFCTALRSVVEELVNRVSVPTQRHKALLSALMQSTENYRGWQRPNEDPESFCNVKAIQEAAVDIYYRHCDVCVQSSEGGERYISVPELQKSPPGVFVTESISKSPLFKVYAKAMKLKEWVIVEGPREYVLFSKAIGSPDWKGIALDRHLYAERMQVFSEIDDSPLIEFVRGDYAVIADLIFGKEAFVVLPANIPKSWKRGEAAAYTKRSVMENCPPRVLINPTHALYKGLAEFAARASSESSGTKLRELKLLLDSLCDGVIENDRVTVARERWKTIQRELRELLSGNLPEVVYDSLVVRR